MSMLNGRRDEAERTGRKVNVAILGAGSIANTMATTLVKMAEDSRYSSWIHPYAVAARDKGRAEAFAAKYGFDTAYGSYADMAADDNVDLVYIATPHNFHAEQAIMCLKAGRNVLVEKAFTANAAQARRRPDCLPRRQSGHATSRVVILSTNWCIAANWAPYDRCARNSAMSCMGATVSRIRISPEAHCSMWACTH